MDDFLRKPIIQKRPIDTINKGFSASIDESSSQADTINDTTTDSTSLVDHDRIERLKALLEDDFEQLKSTFEQNCTLKLSSLDEAIKNNDVKAAHKVAHSLKGTCGSIGAIGMTAIAVELDAQAKQGDSSNFSKLSSRLKEAFLVTLNEFKTY